MPNTILSAAQLAISCEETIGSQEGLSRDSFHLTMAQHQKREDSNQTRVCGFGRVRLYEFDISKSQFVMIFLQAVFWEAPCTTKDQLRAAVTAKDHVRGIRSGA